MAFNSALPYAAVEAASGFQAWLQGGVLYSRVFPNPVTSIPAYIDPAQSPIVYVNGVLQTIGGTVPSISASLVNNTILDTNTSGTTPDTLLTVNYQPTANTTQQQTAHYVNNLYASNFSIVSPGWATAYSGQNQFNGPNAIFKSTVYTAFTSGINGTQINIALGFESVFSGLDATPSNISTYVGFYTANVTGVPGVLQIVNGFYGYRNDYPLAIVANAGRFVKAQNPLGSDQVYKELAPPLWAGGYVAGRYYYGSGTYSPMTPTAMASLVGYIAEYQVQQRQAFTKIGVGVTTSVASSQIRLGIYYLENGIPTTLVVDAGNVSGASIGAAEATFASITLEAGTYALVAVPSVGGISINFLATGEGRNVFGNTTYNGDENAIGVNPMFGSFGALPTTCPAITYFATSLTVPGIWLRL